MPRAEAGSTKAVANQMKSKGLQRLRWYCQVCEKQCRDENGFKCHTQSPSHQDKMLSVGADSRRVINDYSNDFKRDFVQLLRTGHGEKKINANHFYQEYISNKSHVHMSSTKWPSLTEFCKYLGREGICRVDVDEKNEERGGASALMIAWIDNSPEAMRRQEASKKKDRQDRGDEHREQKLIEQQIRRAKDAAAQKELDEQDLEEEEATTQGIKRVDGEKVKLNFGLKPSTAEQEPPSPPLTDKSASPEHEHKHDAILDTQMAENVNVPASDTEEAVKADSTSNVSFKPMSFGAPKPKNVFASAGKKNAFAGVKKTASALQQKPISEAERIMKEELERKRVRDERGGNASKKQRRG